MAALDTGREEYAKKLKRTITGGSIVGQVWLRVELCDPVLLNTLRIGSKRH